MNTKGTPPLKTAWFVWSLGALLYLMAFFQRVVPAVMTEELMMDFQISAVGLGNLSAFYFYSYVAMQIPTGIIADIWGPRRLLSLGALVAGIGSLLFAMAPSLFWASAGRFLIGGSVAVAFVGLLAITASWFPARYYAFVSGVALCFGIIGAVFAGTPLRLLMGFISWRSAIALSALIMFAISIAIWIFVRDYPHEKGYRDLIEKKSGDRHDSFKKIRKGIWAVLKYRNTILLAIIPSGVAGCNLAFSGLWGVPFLVTHYQMTTTQAATLASVLLVSWAVGGPFIGWLSDRTGRRKPLYISGCAMILSGWSCVVFVPGMPIPLLTLVLIVLGFCSGSMMIGFAFAKESVPVHLSGTVTGIVNMGVMIGPTLLQPAIGWVLDRNWQGETARGVRVFSLEAYQSGFLLMIIWMSVSFLLLFLTKETFCRQAAEEKMGSWTSD